MLISLLPLFCIVGIFDKHHDTPDKINYRESKQKQNNRSNNLIFNISKKLSESNIAIIAVRIG